MAIKARGPNDSRSFGDKRAWAFSATLGQGYGKELRDLREDVDEGFRRYEGRSDHPRVDWIDTSVGTTGLTGGTMVLRGANFLQGQSFEAYTHGTGNAALVFTALKPGKFGYKVELTDTGALTVAYSGTTLSITINAGVSTANAIATAVNAAGSACRGIIRCVAGGTGAGFPAALALANFATGNAAAGYGDGFTATVSGVEAMPYHAAGTTPAAAITDTQIILEVPNLTTAAPPRSAVDPLTISVKSDGIYSNDHVFAINDARLIPPDLYGFDNSVNTYAAPGGDITFDGIGLLQGQTFDTLTHGAGASELVFTAVNPGATGISVEILDTAPPNVTVAFGASTVTIEYNSGVHTANDIATAMNVAGSATKYLVRCVSGGAGAVVALAATAMAGGSGSGFLFYFGGELVPVAHAAGTTPAAAVSDTAVTVTVPPPALLATPRTPEDAVTCWCASDGNRSNSLSFKEKEARPVLPELHMVDVAGGLGAAFAAAGGDLDIYGINLLQGQTFDALVHGAGNAELTFEALTPGDSLLEIVIEDGVGEVVAYNAGLHRVTITLNTGVSTANSIATAVNANGAQTDGILRATAGGTGLDNPVAMALTPMAGGVGAGFQAFVGGHACLPANEVGTAPVRKINNDRIVITTPAMGAAADVVSVFVVSDGVRSVVDITGVLA